LYVCKANGGLLGGSKGGGVLFQTPKKATLKTKKIMSRAGSDIGYCDSDYRNNNTVSNLPSEEDVTKHLESIGFHVADVRVGDKDLDIYIEYDGLAYDLVDLDWDCYESFGMDDYLKEYDDVYSMCCGASVDTDVRRCGSCREAL